MYAWYSIWNLLSEFLYGSLILWNRFGNGERIFFLPLFQQVLLAEHSMQAENPAMLYALTPFEIRNIAGANANLIGIVMEYYSYSIIIL